MGLFLREWACGRYAAASKARGRGFGLRRPTRAMMSLMAYRPIPRTKCLVDPPPAVMVAPDIFQLAVQELETVPEPGLSSRAKAAVNHNQARRAFALLRAIDWTAFDWFWTDGGNEWYRRHDKSIHAQFAGPKARPISAEIKRVVATRDGWTCRYCGLRVLVSATMAALERRLPAALPMAEKVHASIGCHPMQCVMRLTWDHVNPHAHGGGSNEDNVVTTCGVCNFQKGDCSLEELSLQDPRERPQPSTSWDGLHGRLGARLL